MSPSLLRATHHLVQWTRLRSNDELSSIFVWKKTQILDFGCPTYIFYRKKNTLVRYIPFQKKKRVPPDLPFSNHRSQEQSGRSCCGLTIQVGDEAKVGFVGIIDPFLRGKKFFHLHGNVETKKKRGRGHFRKRRRGESNKKWKRSKQSVEHVLFSTGLIFVVGGICYCIWWQIWQGAQHI